MVVTSILRLPTTMWAVFRIIVERHAKQRPKTIDRVHTKENNERMNIDFVIAGTINRGSMKRILLTKIILQ